MKNLLDYISYKSYTLKTSFKNENLQIPENINQS